jgi:cyanophycin synthetase
MKVPADVVRARAESFAADMDKVPARFNVLEIQGATVIVDYGHNADALAALIPVMDKFPHLRRTCVYSTAGDRRDCDMVRQGELLGDAFDQVVLYEDHYLRGRQEGEIIRLFRGGVEKGDRVKQIEEIRGADAAVEFALRRAQSGDLILIQADTVDETVSFIRHYVESITPEPALDDSIEPAATPPVASGKPAAVVQVAAK